MNEYFQDSTDASYQYRPSAAAESAGLATTALSGNLSDVMKNSTIYRPHAPQQVCGPLEHAFSVQTARSA